MQTLTPEQRRARIAELEAELAELRRQDAAELQVDIDSLRAKCKVLVSAGKTVDAVNHYKTAMRCTLREAHSAVVSL